MEVREWDEKRISNFSFFPSFLIPYFLSTSFPIPSSGIRDDSGSNTYTNNLITTVLFLGTYGDRKETQNLHWYGALQLDNALNTVLISNVVAGTYMQGFVCVCVCERFCV